MNPFQVGDKVKLEHPRNLEPHLIIEDSYTVIKVSGTGIFLDHCSGGDEKCYCLLGTWGHAYFVKYDLPITPEEARQAVRMVDPAEIDMSFFGVK